MRRPVGRRGCLLSRLVRAVVLCLALSAAPSRADERLAPGAWLVGLEVQQRSFDTMSAGDARPLARGDVGARLSVERLLGSRWALGLSSHFGGSWLDWSDEVYNISGKIEDAAWGARVGVDRVLPLGAGGTGLVGVGMEYAEARSWLHTLGVQQDLSDEGPRCYTTGGYARFLAMTPLWHRTALCAQVSQSVYGAHATDPPFSTRYDWLGRSLTVSVGLRLGLARGGGRRK